MNFWRNIEVKSHGAKWLASAEYVCGREGGSYSSRSTFETKEKADLFVKEIRNQEPW